MEEEGGEPAHFDFPGEPGAEELLHFVAQDQGDGDERERGCYFEIEVCGIHGAAVGVGKDVDGGEESEVDEHGPAASAAAPDPDAEVHAKKEERGAAAEDGDGDDDWRWEARGPGVVFVGHARTRLR